MNPDYFYSLAWTPMITAEITALHLIFPFLNIWPVSFIFDAAYRFLTNRLYSALNLFFSLELIAFKNAQHLQAYSNASVELKVIAEEKGVNSDEFKAAQAQALTTLSAFVHLN